VKTLLVDGDNLFKIGFHGVRDLFVEGNHIGGVFHFINTLRKQIDEHNYDKIIVFWDGDDNSAVRRKLYPNYKLNRRQSMNEFKLESYHIQKQRVKEYLEECFVRQVRATECEADDLIAYYCQIANEE
jgi:5'-3' exonuclease